MAAPRFLNIVTGRIKQLVALVVSTGSADGEKIVATDTDGKLHDSVMGAATSGSSVIVKSLPDGTIDPSLMPAGIGANVVNIVASEALSANDLVNVWNDAGTAKIRKADATTEGKEADGYVKAAVALNATGAVYLGSRISGLSGRTPGARQYLSTTAGLMVETAPAATGNVVQWVGTAVSATEVDFKKANPITLA